MKYRKQFAQQEYFHLRLSRSTFVVSVTFCLAAMTATAMCNYPSGIKVLLCLLILLTMRKTLRIILQKDASSLQAIKWSHDTGWFATFVGQHRTYYVTVTNTVMFGPFLYIEMQLPNGQLSRNYIAKDSMDKDAWHDFQVILRNYHS